MGTYFVLAEQINKLADRLEREGKLEDLFKQAHQLQQQASVDKLRPGIKRQGDK